MGHEPNYPRPNAYRLVVNAFWLFFLPTLLLAQTPSFDEDWRWVRFSTESGLPANQVVALDEATDGTVWIATTSGIAWFDGLRWMLIDTAQGVPGVLLNWYRGKTELKLRPFSGKTVISG